MPNFQSALKLKKYTVDNIDFHVDNVFFQTNAKDHLVINPIFNRSITKIDANNVSASLNITVDDKNHGLPFFLNITVSGIFNLENWEYDENKTSLISNNTMSILFPYLRSLVSLVTMNANIPPYILPIVNIVALFEEENKTSK